MSVGRFVAEAAVIVASILLAFAIDAWWDTRGDRMDEREALREIHQNLVEDSVDMQLGGVATFTGYVASGNWVMDHLGLQIPTDSAAEMLRPLGTRHLYQPQSSGFDGLRTSGRLGIIRDDSLRADLIRYYEHGQQELVQLVTWLGDQADRTLESLELDVVHRRWIDEGSPPEMSLRRPWRDMPSDPRFPARVSRLRSLSELALAAAYPRYFALNRDLRRRIQEQLGR